MTDLDWRKKEVRGMSRKLKIALTLVTIGIVVKVVLLKKSSEIIIDDNSITMSVSKIG